MRGKKIVGKTNKRKQWQRKKKKQAYFEVKIERGSNHRRNMRERN